MLQAYKDIESIKKELKKRTWNTYWYH
jgi:hypothetical protein